MNINNVKFEASFGTSSQLKNSDLPEIVFSGKSNVGKSSLINKFFNRKNLARVSSQPGKTTTINFFLVDDVRIADLPGYGYAKRSQESKRSWSGLTEDYFLKNPSSDAIKLVIQLIDVRTGPTDDDIMMINFMIDNAIPFTVVATKTDKLSKAQLTKALADFEENYFKGTGITVLPFSSVTRDGKNELWNIIAHAAEK